MEIYPDASVRPLGPGPAIKTPPRPRSTADSAQFDAADELDRALRAEPEVRPGEVERAERLIGDVAYPPPETIRRLAVLLAMHLDEAPAPE